MMMSPPILVAAATPVHFLMRQRHLSVLVMIRFYTDAAGTVEMGALGTGSRDLTATTTASAYQGPFSFPTRVVPDIACNIDGGALAAVPDGELNELLLGPGLDRITIVAAVNVNAAGSVTYRVFVDAPGDSTI